jgi:hypothetical protein
MNNQTGPTAGPASILTIAGDSTAWGLRDVGPEDPGWTGPVKLPIVVPVEGKLVLAPARVGGLALVDPDWRNGWVPAKLGLPHLFIPTGTALTNRNADALGYPLAPPDDDTEALAEKLVIAMRRGSTIKVALDIVDGGVVVLNGAMLAYAAVAPAN